MSKKTKKVVLVSLIVLVAIIFVVGIGIGAYIIVKNSQSMPVLTIAKYFDANKNEIHPSQSVIDGIEGVKYISLQVNAQNKDTTILSFKIVNATPSSFSSALQSAKEINVSQDKTGSWVSGMIDISSYTGTTQIFSVNVQASSPLRQTTIKESSISIKIDPDPVSAFDVSIVSSVNNTAGTTPACVEAWTCTDWNTCASSLQSRSCTDSNQCGTTESKPITSQSCVSPFLTNAVSGNYKVTGVWITVNGLTYTYNGYSSYTCLSADTIMTTPEGNAICTRSGYDISSRLYLQQGTYGVIFAR